jgi:vacuolar-type H+-ATPase subunit I/STV1
MSKAWLVVGLTAIAVILAPVAWRLNSPLESERPVTQTASRDTGAAAARSATESAASAADEIGALRRRLDDETRARRQLERRLEALEREVAGLDSASQRGPEIETGSAAGVAEGEAVSADGARRAWFDEQALIASGIDEARARELKLYFEQLELERLRLRDRAAREGWDGSRRRQEFALLGEREEALREQLGEDEYAAYLYAAGRPNSVEISSVLASAPAGQAGIRPGDRILRYAGERIYSPRELRVATTGGEFGDPVEIEVERDGETLRFYLARGPMGVRTGPLSVAP